MKTLDILIRRVFPPIFIVLFPYYMFCDNMNSLDIGKITFLGYPVLLLGLIIYAKSLWRWDADKTNELIIDGLYKYSRNPQYLGTILIILGNSLILNSSKLINTVLLIFLSFNIFIIFIEEKKMKRTFGEEYKEYCKKTGRWFYF